MNARPDFTEQQYRFAAHIRDPEHQPAPDGIEDRRMQIYRELFYNNVESFISSTFPVLRKIYSDTDWEILTRDYFAHHHAQTPLFLEIPREFLNWLENEREPGPGDLPFLYELAHYEWVELALSISEETLEQPGIDPAGDLLNGIPAASPLAWQLAYRFPVHKIGPDYLPDKPGESPTFLVVYRDAADEIGFLEINPVTKRLLELVAEDSDATGKELLNKIAQEMAHPDPAVVVAGGADILKNLRDKNILLGTKSR